MKLIAIAKKNILKLIMLGIFTTIFSGNFLSPSLAQSEGTKITLGDRVDPNPLVFSGVSGGNISAVEIVQIEGTATGFCNGFIKKKPNHVLNLSSFLEFLKIEVDSNSDTTIIVEGPGGVWCNDDSNNANPAIEGEWQPGKYKIWVGSYQEDSNNSYQLKITGSN